MDTSRKQILLTNDDGIDSPGLWAAAQALSSLGYVTVVAPSIQYSGAGRSHPLQTDGQIKRQVLKIGGQEWPAYAVNGSPAQSVLYAVYDICQVKPDLLVSGINYGENIGLDITLSGTVGAAMEGAVYGIPSLATSLQLNGEGYTSNSHQVDFSTAAWFTQYFARLILEKGLPEETDMLKIDVPAQATPDTPWKVVRLIKECYFRPYLQKSDHFEEARRIKYLSVDTDRIQKAPGTDAYAVAIEKLVAVTPLTLDMSARTSTEVLTNYFKN